MAYLVNLANVNLTHVDMVGGKNASTGEMLQNLSKKGVHIPGGIATTADAFRAFLSYNHLDQKINQALSALKTDDIKKLNKTSATIRRWIEEASFMPGFEAEVKEAYRQLGQGAVAVRSSATAEDLATASFAGAQETFLNVKGIKPLLEAIKRVYASLYNSRAISYRTSRGFIHDAVSLSVGIQPMIRSDKATSGVMFTVDTESGFDKIILITASYGLGEGIVQGHVNPDEFIVYKPCIEQKKSAILQRRLGSKAIKMVYATAKNKLVETVPVSLADRQRFCINDSDIQTLAKQALIIEKHYQKPMDIEWAKDGITGKIWIVQARPETVISQQENNVIERYTLSKKTRVLTEGLSIGNKIGAGTARVVNNPTDAHVIKRGDVLVTDMTDPDWEPIMKLASAIVTNRGGRTCHAAIIARELGIPAIIGCGNATKLIKDKQAITVSCVEGNMGVVYEGNIPFKVARVAVNSMPDLPVRLCLNVGNPGRAFNCQRLPNHGVGLARLEFIISHIGIHPNALLQLDKLPAKLQREIITKTACYDSPTEYYIEKLKEGIATIAAAFYPKEVIFRFSDFKSNEYANLLGGNQFEPSEENPMLGFRGASRYYDDRFKQCFKMECEAFKRVRDEMGITNAQVMVPFVRTVKELTDVITLIEQNGLKREKNGLKIYMMCEIPSNVILAKEFLKHVDGFSIGSNDLTQLTLGLDRDSHLIAHLFDERNQAVKDFLGSVISQCRKQKKYIGICGQAPSDYPEFAKWLMEQGIQSMSLNPDTIVDTWLSLAKK